MANLIVGKPEASEYAPHYGTYISLIEGDDIVAALSDQLKASLSLLRAIPEERGDYRYGPDKWSIKELVGHITDCERIFAYRALRIARNDKTPLPGFEQDDYVKYGPFAHCQLQSLVSEFEHVRLATIGLLKHLDEAAWTRRGTANDKEISVRALAYAMAGHEKHHMEILRTRYL